MVRVTGMEAMLLSVPWVQDLLHTAGAAVSQLWSVVTQMTGSNSRDKRDITQDHISEFLEQVRSALAYFRAKIQRTVIFKFHAQYSRSWFK